MATMNDTIQQLESYNFFVSTLVSSLKTLHVEEYMNDPSPNLFKITLGIIEEQGEAIKELKANLPPIINETSPSLDEDRVVPPEPRDEEPSFSD